MDLNIIEKQNDVIYEIPKIQFPAYEEYKEKAYAVAEHIYGMDPTEENIKETKATLAKARKLTDRLNTPHWHTHHDPFKDVHPNTSWRECLEHAEKIGLGSRKYELIRM